VLLNDTDPENNSLTAVKVTDPTHGTLTLNANGTFTYTHNNDSATSDSFTYRASDGPNQSNITTVTITINPGGGTPTTVTFQDGVNGYADTIDTTIKGAFPTSTSGSTATTVEATDNPDKGSLLRWQLPSSLTGNIVQSASINLFVTNNTTATYQLYELLRTWTEAGATWNQFAAGTNWGTAGAQQIGVDRAAAVIGSLTAPSTNQFVTINLNSTGIALVQKWINTPSTNHGVTIQNYVTTTADGVGFDSSEAPTIANRPKLSITYVPGTPLVAATTASVTSSAQTGSTLTDSALARIGQEATARWLTSTPLGTSFEHTILIDRDAAGFGWFIDRTPRDDREFGASHQARPTSPASGHMDLLSVVAHEIGHLLGYDHGSAFGGLPVMHESLEAGQRTMAVDAYFQSVSAHHGRLNPFM
jgi:VCBS repeat-containing protein